MDISESDQTSELNALQTLEGDGEDYHRDNSQNLPERVEARRLN